MGKRRDQTCVYCGYVGKLTRDHVPPENLFAKPKPSNLITVPCCRKCQKGTSQDDEYFRLMLVMRSDAGEHAEAKKVWPTVFRSLQRPQAKGLTASLLRNVHHVSMSSQGGIYLGERAAYNVEAERIDRVAQRIVKGLFWRKYGERLPTNYEAVAWNDSGLANVEADTQEMARRMCAELVENPPSEVGTVFEYWAQAVPEDKYMTAWLLRFFGSVCFFCITAPTDQL